MRHEREVAQVLAFAKEGLNNCEIARMTGIPRETVRDWIRGRVPRGPEASRRRARVGCVHCGGPKHSFDELPAEAYAYLLGTYLGDGFLARSRRGVYRLRITLDDRYPGIIAECKAAAEAVLPRNEVGTVRRVGQGCSDVSVFSKTLICLFPQHGPGPKHTRPIRLVDWQQRLVQTEPQSFLRGLIHSDGCRFINPVRHGEKLYEYPRYNFSNASADIRQLFCDACDLLGIEWRVMNARNISVARRASVARLDEFVGPKR
jgi:Homeodomain-like domain